VIVGRGDEYLMIRLTYAFDHPADGKGQNVGVHLKDCHTEREVSENPVVIVGEDKVTVHIVSTDWLNIIMWYSRAHVSEAQVPDLRNRERLAHKGTML
jgi:hypothetical protein